VKCPPGTYFPPAATDPPAFVVVPHLPPPSSAGTGFAAPPSGFDPLPSSKDDDILRGQTVATLDERVAFLEGQMVAQSRILEEIRTTLVQFEQRVDARFEAIDRRFEAIDRRFEAIDHRFEAIDRRFEAIDRRFEAIDRRFEIIEARLNALDDKLSRSMMWLFGAQVTTLVAIVTVLATALFTR
jgi:tetrahydromethanopterin S-methyltransferase subunit G